MGQFGKAKVLENFDKMTPERILQVSLVLACLQAVESWDYGLVRRRRSETPVSLDTKCSSDCLNDLRLSTETNDTFQSHFIELSRLSSVVPQVLISSVDLTTFQNYCQDVYIPARECLFSCSNTFTPSVLRNLTMLETLCVDYYREMNIYMSCMKSAYKTANPACESKCMPSNDSTTLTSQNRTVLTSGITENGSNVTAMDQQSQQTDRVYLRPNETMSLFCWLLECVSLCEVPVLEKQCGHPAAVLEGVLVDSMARTSKLAAQADGNTIWPNACNKLMLPNSGQRETSTSYIAMFTINLLALGFFVLRKY